MRKNNLKWMGVSAIIALILIVSFIGIGLAKSTKALIAAGKSYESQLTPTVFPTLPVSDNSSANIDNSGIIVPSPQVLPEPEIINSQLVAGPEHTPLILIGATRSSLEYSCQGDGHFQYQDFLAMKSWGMNAVRITLSSQLWLDPFGQCPTYQATVQQAVSNAESAGLYIVLALQWNAPFNDPNSAGGSQYPLPDASKDDAFWDSVSTVFGNDFNVMFEPFSEPHDVTFQQWFNGGTVTITSANDTISAGMPKLIHGTYLAEGMRQLVDTIRANTAAVIILDGVNYGFDLSMINNPHYRFTRNNIMFSTHPWDYANKAPATWPAAFGNLLGSYPIMITEFGEYDCSTGYVSQLIPYAESHKMSFFAWSWNVGSCQGSSALFSGWNGAPNSAYSAYIRLAMLQYADDEK